VSRHKRPKLNLPETDTAVQAGSPEEVWRQIAADPHASPLAKLKASDRLHELEQAKPRSDAYAVMPVEDLEAEVDQLTLQAVTACLSGSGEHPRTGALLARAIERRADELVRERTDVQRVEEEIERRAEERARQLYAGRAFQLVTDAQTRPEVAGASTGDKADRDISRKDDAQGEAASASRPNGVQPPAGLSWEDVARPWQRPRSRRYGR
jgi:hypothetical protein